MTTLWQSQRFMTEEMFAISCTRLALIVNSCLILTTVSNILGRVANSSVRRYQTVIESISNEKEKNVDTCIPETSHRHSSENKKEIKYGGQCGQLT